MIYINQQLCLELETTNQAIRSFILGYTSKMDYPLTHLDSVIDKIEKSEDPRQLKVHAETMQRTLGEMESTLKTLMNEMEVLQNHL